MNIFKSLIRWLVHSVESQEGPDSTFQLLVPHNKKKKKAINEILRKKVYKIPFHDQVWTVPCMLYTYAVCILFCRIHRILASSVDPFS